MAEEPQQQRDDRAARKQQLNGQIRARVACDLNQCVHDAFTLSFRRAGDSVHPDEGHAMGRAYSADFGSRPICCPFVSSRGGNCPYDRPVNRIAIHDVERMIRGNIVWAAWEEGGFWGVDISDIHRPDAAAWFVPPVRSDSARGTSHGDDMTTADGIIFGNGSDAGAGGLWAMRYVPGFKGTVSWNAQENGVIVKAG